MSNVNMVRYQEAIDEWRANEARKGPIPSRISLYTELHEKAVEKGDSPFLSFLALIYPVPNTPLSDADITVMTTHSYYTRNTDIEDPTRQIIEQHQQIIWIEKFFRIMFLDSRNAGLQALLIYMEFGIQGVSSANIF